MPVFATAAQSADLIERYIAADEMSRARGLLDEILPAVGKNVAAFQDPSQVSFNAGFAYVCICLNRPGRALQYAELALLNDPQDAVVHALLSESQKLYFAREFIRRGRTASAVAILELLRETDGSDAARQKLALLEFYEAERARIGAQPRHPVHDSGRRPLLMNVVVWGADYMRPLLEYGLPSLLADGNIPHCARDREVILDIYTSAADRAPIENSAAGVAAARHAALRFNIIPDALLYPEPGGIFNNADRWLVGGAQLCSALRAWQIGADLTFLCSSGVYADECFAAASAFIDGGYAAVMTCPPRARETVVHGKLRKYAKIAADRIDIDAASLSAFIVENLHPHCRDLFLTDPPRSARQDPTTLYFATPSGYANRTFQPCPLLISHDLLRGDIRFDYMTTDARFVAELLRGRDPDGAIKIAQNPVDGLVFTDIDGGAGAGMKEYAELPVTVEVCAACVLGTAYRESDLEFYQWLLRQRFATAVDKGPSPDGGVDEQAAVDRLLDLVRQGSGSVREKIGTYENSAPAAAASV